MTKSPAGNVESGVVPPTRHEAGLPTGEIDRLTSVQSASTSTFADEPLTAFIGVYSRKFQVCGRWIATVRGSTGCT